MNYYLQAVFTTVLPVLTAICGYLISYFNAKREIQELAKSKTELEESILKNSYFICPGCGRVIRASEIDWHDDKKGENNNGLSNQ